MNRTTTFIAISVGIVTLLLVVSYVNAIANPSSVIIDQFAQDSDILPSSINLTTASPTINQSVFPKLLHLMPDFSVWFVQSVLIAASIFVVVYWRRLKNQWAETLF